MSKLYIYYLYDSDGIVRYVGRGRRDRFKTVSGRSEEYLSILNNGGESKIIEFCEDTQQVILKELEHIELHKATIINKIGSFEHNHLKYEELDKIFQIDETSPSGIVWKTDRYNVSGALCVRAGTRAGSLTTHRRYWCVPYNGKYVKVHRVIMVLHLKEDLNDPEILINHIDGDGTNNKLSNLELSSYRHNAIYRTKHTKNTSGVVGVTAYMSRGKLTWRARITDEGGKRIQKDFSTVVYGDEAFNMACEYRKLLEILYLDK